MRLKLLGTCKRPVGLGPLDFANDCKALNRIRTIFVFAARWTPGNTDIPITTCCRTNPQKLPALRHTFNLHRSPHVIMRLLPRFALFPRNRFREHRMVRAGFEPAFGRSALRSTLTQYPRPMSQPPKRFPHAAEPKRLVPDSNRLFSSSTTRLAHCQLSEFDSKGCTWP